MKLRRSPSQAVTPCLCKETEKQNKEKAKQTSGTALTGFSIDKVGDKATQRRNHATLAVNLKSPKFSLLMTKLEYFNQKQPSPTTFQTSEASKLTS